MFLRNGATQTAPLVGKYCGTSIPQKIRSFSNSIYLEFHSDSSIEEKGFEILWDSTITGCFTLLNMHMRFLLTLLSGCGGSIANSHVGSITSPNYPREYGVNALCEWRITTSKGSTLLLMFSDINLEQGNTECIFDSLEV